jgi:hypothetical protein
MSIIGESDLLTRQGFHCTIWGEPIYDGLGQLFRKYSY